MKKILALICMIFLLSCTAPQPEPQKMLIQCWDGSIAESPEECPPARQVEPETPKLPVVEEPPVAQDSEPVAPPEPEPVKSSVEKLLDSMEKVYTYQTNGTISYVSYDKRIIRDEVMTRDHEEKIVYHILDRKTNTLHLDFGEVSEMWWAEHKGLPKPKGVGARTKTIRAYLEFELTGKEMVDEQNWPSDRYDRPLMIDVLEKVYASSPTELISKYKKEPMLSEDSQRRELFANNKKFISEKMLKFKKIDNPAQTITFYLEQRTNLPLLIEVRNNQGIIIETYEFNLVSKDLWSTSSKEIHTSVPEDSAIMNLADLDALLEQLEDQERGSGDGGSYTINIYIF